VQGRPKPLPALERLQKLIGQLKYGLSIRRNITSTSIAYIATLFQNSLIAFFVTKSNIKPTAIEDMPAFTMNVPAATAINTDIIVMLDLKIPDIASFFDKVA